MLHHRTRSKCQCPATQDRRQLGQGPACQHVCYAENPSHHEVQGASKTWRANFYPPKWTNYDKFRIWKHPFHTSSPISNRKIPGSMRIWPGGQQGAIWAPSLTGCRFDHQLYPYTLVYILISIPSIPYILICMGESSQSLLLKVLILGWLLTPCIPIHYTNTYPYLCWFHTTFQFSKNPGVVETCWDIPITPWASTVVAFFDRSRQERSISSRRTWGRRWPQSLKNRELENVRAAKKMLEQQKKCESTGKHGDSTRDSARRLTTSKNSFWRKSGWIKDHDTNIISVSQTWG